MPEIGDMVAARVVAQYAGQPIINTLTFVLVVPFATWTEAAGQLVTDIDSALGVLSPGGDWTDQLNEGYVIQAIQAVDVFPGIAPLLSIASTAVGAITASDGMPPNDALCVTFRSDFKGPSGRGRIYFSGWPESLASGGFWLAAAQDQAALIAQALIDNFGEGSGGAQFRWSILHRVAGGAPIVPPEVKPVMSFTVHNEVRSLGRRAVGRRISRRAVV